MPGVQDGAAVAVGNGDRESEEIRWEASDAKQGDSIERELE